MGSFEGMDLKEEDLKYWYYHWFWGLYQTKSVIHSNNMELVFHRLKYDRSLQSVVKQQALSFQKKNLFTQFFYWLFNIDNFAMNRHTYFLMQELIEKEERYEEKEIMHSNQSLYEAKNDDLQNQRDIVDEIQLIFSGKYDAEGVLLLPNDLRETCDNLDERIYEDLLKPYQALARSTHLSLRFFFNQCPKAWSNFVTSQKQPAIHEAHALLKKYQARFNRVIMLLSTELYPLTKRYSNEPRLSNYSLILHEVELLLIKNLRCMGEELPWHTELHELLRGKLIGLIEGWHLLKKYPDLGLTVTNKTEPDLKILGIQTRVGERVQKNAIDKAFRRAALRDHPDKGGKKEKFQQLEGAKDRLGAACRQQNSEEDPHILERLYHQDISHLRFLWIKDQEQLTEHMNKLRLRPEKKVALWEIILKKRACCNRDDLNSYIHSLRVRIVCIRVCLNEIKQIMQLRDAVRQNDKTTVRELLEAGVSPNGILHSDCALPDCALLEHREPLLRATSLKDPYIFQLVLDKNADVSVTTPSGCTVAERVALSRFEPIIKKNILDALAQKGVSLPPIFYAACFGEERMVEEQLQLGVLESRDNYGNTALHYAAANNQLELCLMLHHYNSALIAVKNKENVTPITWAIRHDHVPVVTCLLSKGAEFPKNIGEVSAKMSDFLKEYVAARVKASSTWSILGYLSRAVGYPLSSKQQDPEPSECTAVKMPVRPVISEHVQTQTKAAQKISWLERQSDRQSSRDEEGVEEEKEGAGEAIDERFSSVDLY